MHLFDLDLSSSNGPKLQESATTVPGSSLLSPYDSPIGSIGALICFDLRFPEPALALRSRGAEVLLYPSAFTRRTGAAHWHALLRARAIETQCYVIAAAQVGKHNEKRETYGHGMIVDPWGEIVAELGGVEDMKEGWEPEVAVAEIDLEKVREVRRGLPLVRRT